MFAHFAARRNITHAVNITDEVNITCPQGQTSFKKAYHLRDRLFCGCGTRIRTQTNRVRVCRATVTQFRTNAIYYSKYIFVCQYLFLIIFEKTKLFRVFSKRHVMSGFHPKTHKRSFLKKAPLDSAKTLRLLPPMPCRVAAEKVPF